MKLSPLFTNHAVLQRDQVIPVWGWAQANTQVIVKIGDNIAQTTSTDEGKFIVRLPAMKAGGPYTLEAEASELGERVQVDDILIGEVWLASGQSNMQWTLTSVEAAGEIDCKTCDDVQLRMITVPNTAKLGRQRDFNGSWRLCTPKNAPSFTAVGYFFAKRLRDELGIPVGIINSSWGGTIVEAWTSRDWLSRNPYTSGVLARYEADVFTLEAQSAMTTSRESVFTADPGNQGAELGWNQTGFDDAEWDEIKLPRSWQAAGHAYSGIFWFRKEIDVPESWEGKDLILGIGAVDKQDITYFNGEKVGSTGTGFEENCWAQSREYRVPGNLVKKGRNVIAVRAYSFVYSGGMIGPAQAMSVTTADDSDQPISISGNWKYKNEHNFGLVQPPQLPPGPNNPNSPYILYDSMIHPLIPYGIRGAIWYQGESNADKYNEYQSLLSDMIRNWRLDWGQGDFPFLIVQLANYLSANKHPTDSVWARIREAQLKTLSEPETGLAVTIDIGNPLDIHPSNKRDVGKRLAQWALSKTYHKNIVPSGPLYKKMRIEANKIHLEFDYTGEGLIAKDGALNTFQIAGKDREFHPAKAVIDGDTVIVHSDDEDIPVAVRYGWEDAPENCNLYNKEGLPASPFRTDSW